MATMKREVSRKRVLPTFRIDVAELQLLWARLLGLFDPSEKVYASLTIELGNEKFNFEDINDIGDCADLPPTVKHFSMYMSQGDRSITVAGVSLIGARPEARASGDTEAWCAG